MWFKLTGDERLGRCTTNRCGGQPTWHLERGGVGSDYCSGCKEKIERLVERRNPDMKDDMADKLMRWECPSPCACMCIDRLADEIEQLRTAAKPFADHDWYDAELEDDNCQLVRHSGPVTVGHWKALRRVFEATK